MLARQAAAASCERLKDGTWLGHVAEHVAIELQREAGAQIVPGQDARRRQPGPVQRHLRLRGGAGRPRGRPARRPARQPPGPAEEGFDFLVELEDLIRLAEQPGVRPLDAGARRRGDEPRHPLDPAERAVARPARTGQVPAAHPRDHDVQHVGAWRSTSPATRSSPRACWPPPGCRCPAAEVVRNGGRGRRSGRARIGYPVVTKPLDGNHGRGVGLDLRDDEARPDGLRASAEPRSATRRGRRRVAT